MYAFSICIENINNDNIKQSNNQKHKTMIIRNYFGKIQYMIFVAPFNVEIKMY